MTLRPGSPLILCTTLLLAATPLFAATPLLATRTTARKPHPQPVVSHVHKAAATATRSSKSTHQAAARTSVRGKKVRIPRTLRTIPVSPIVRENAVDRVEANLTESSTSPFVYPNAMNLFFKALAEEQAQRTASTPDAPVTDTVRILQFGDSHTAADIFTGAMRAHMQAQYGDGGLGFQFPGHPFAGYHLAGSQRSQSSGWFTEGNRFTSLGDGDLGLGGISITAERPNETVTLGTSCTTLQLHYLQQPGGGRLQFTDNGTTISTIDTGGATGAEATTSTAGTFAYACTAGTHDFTFTTLDHAPVKLLGIVTEQPGVTYECLGINGAVAPLILRWNQALFTEYLRQRDPALIVLAYGTNESGSSAEHLTGYPAELGRIVDTMHLNAPNASVLILGPADRAMASRVGRRSSWHAFGGTDRIITMQKEVCRTHGCTFWDTRRRMGGFGAMQQWVSAGWAQPDRTHLTGTGYHELADALYADLIHAYNQYQQHPDIPIQESRNGKAPRHP
jgi:hypothetical protein